jgi:uncharacterized protein (DUF427 family)
MSLTLGSGPLTANRAGVFNFDIDAASPKHTIYIEAVPQRIRAVLNGETVIDTRRAKVLYESNIMGQWYVPAEDVRADLLTPTGTSTHCPFKGDASYWTLTVGDRSLPDVMWGYEDPLPGSAAVKGMRAVYFDRMDAWYEEEERVFAHPRDPYHRVDARRSTDHVTVRIGGEVVAETTRPLKVFETSLPARWYVPAADVTAEITGSETTSQCPYKGQAIYHTVAGAADAAWSYPKPLPGVEAIAGLLSFDGDGDGVEVSVEPGS